MTVSWKEAHPLVTPTTNKKSRASADIEHCATILEEIAGRLCNVKDICQELDKMLLVDAQEDIIISDTGAEATKRGSFLCFSESKFFTETSQEV